MAALIVAVVPMKPKFELVLVQFTNLTCAVCYTVDEELFETLSEHSQ